MYLLRLTTFLFSYTIFHIIINLWSVYMDHIDYLNILLKYTFINLIICYLYIKISNFKLLTIKNKLIIFLTCIILSIMISLCSTFINPSYTLIASYFTLSFLYTYITKYNIHYSIVVTFYRISNHNYYI